MKLKVFCFIVLSVLAKSVVYRNFVSVHWLDPEELNSISDNVSFNFKSFEVSTSFEKHQVTKESPFVSILSEKEETYDELTLKLISDSVPTRILINKILMDRMVDYVHQNLITFSHDSFKVSFRVQILNLSYYNNYQSFTLKITYEASNPPYVGICDDEAMKTAVFTLDTSSENITVPVYSLMDKRRLSVYIHGEKALYLVKQKIKIKLICYYDSSQNGNSSVGDPYDYTPPSSLSSDFETTINHTGSLLRIEFQHRDFRKFAVDESKNYQGEELLKDHEFCPDGYSYIQNDLANSKVILKRGNLKFSCISAQRSSDDRIFNLVQESKTPRQVYATKSIRNCSNRFQIVDEKTGDCICHGSLFGEFCEFDAKDINENGIGGVHNGKMYFFSKIPGIEGYRSVDVFKRRVKSTINYRGDNLAVFIFLVVMGIIALIIFVTLIIIIKKRKRLLMFAIELRDCKAKDEVGVQQLVQDH